MIGGGCTFLKLARKVDEVKETLENDEQKVRRNAPPTNSGMPAPVLSTGRVLLEF